MATEAVQLEHNSESLQYSAQKYGNVPATDNNSSSYATTKDEALNLAEEEKLSGRKGEIIIEPPIDIQFSLKETDVQCVNIVSEKLKDEGHLTGNNNNIEARSETDDTAHTLMEEATSDMDVLTLDKASIIVESASQKTLQQKDEAPSEEKENESHDTTDVKKVEGVNENKHAKIEAETGIPYVESTGDSDDMPIAECLQHLQETTQKGPDPAEAEPVDENSEGPFKVDPKDAEKEKHDGINDDIRLEVETGKFNEEGIQVTNNISAKEPAEKENTQEAPEIAQPLEVATRGELESANDGPEDDKLSIPFNVNPEEPDEQNTKRTNEDKLEKREAESGICREESTNCMESISVAEPSEELNREETLATTTNEDPEPPEDGQDRGKFESPLEFISTEPEADLERENEVAETSQEQNTHCISPKEPAEKENIQEVPEIAQPLDVATRGELESADDGPEDDMLNLPFNVNTEEPEEENTERANEDRHRKIEAESATYSEERTHSMESISVVEPSGEENGEESLETTTNKGPELPEDGQCGKFESPLESISTKPDAELQRENEEPSQEQYTCHLEIINEKILQPANDEPDSDKPEYDLEETPKELGEGMLGIANEDAKIEVETSSRERDIHCTPVAKPSEQENLEEPPETTEAAGNNKQESGEVESPLGAVAERPEPDNLHKVNEENNAEIVAHDIDNQYVVQPSEKENKHETFLITTEEAPESAGGEQDVLKLEGPIGAVAKKPDAENFERINEDEHVEMEAETGSFNDERENDTHTIPVREYQNKLITQEPLKVAATENVKLAEDETGGKLENPLDALPEEPELTVPFSKLSDSSLEADSLTAKHEIEGTCQEELVISVEKSALEDEKRYRAIEKVESEPQPDYQNTSISALFNETKTTNEENRSSTEYDNATGTTGQGGELHKDAPNSTSELSQRINKDMYQQETEPDPDETSQQAFQEHDNSNNTLKDSKTASADMDSFRVANEDLSTSHALEEDQIWQTTESEVVAEQKFTGNNENEVHERNIDWQTELLVVKETHEKTEEPRSIEAAPEASSIEKIVAEKLNDENLLEQRQESYKDAADSDNLQETADEITLDHVLQKETWEDKLENPSKEVEKKVLEISPTEEVEKEDPSEEREERFTSDDGIHWMVDQAVSDKGIEDMNTGADSVHAENGNAISQDLQSEVKKIEDNGRKVISNDSLPDIHNETSQKVENIDGEASHPLNEEKTDESITINGGDNFGKSKAGKLENSSDSVTNELNLEELAPAIVCGEDKTSEVANTDDGEVVKPPSNNLQETCVEVPQQQIRTVSENASAEITSTLKDEKKGEDNRTSLPEEELEDDPQKKVEETTAISEEDKHIAQVTRMNIETMGDTLYSNGVSFNDNMQEAVTTIAQQQIGRTIERDGKDEEICSNEHIKEQDIDASLQKDNPEDEPRKKQEDTHEAIKEAKNTKPVSQMCIETLGDNFSADDASLDKNMHKASDVVAEEQMYTKTEDGSIEIKPISTNENRREQDIDKSQPKEELKDEPRKKEEITHEEISGMVKPDGGKGDGNCEADLNKNLDDCPNSHVLDEETTDAEAGQTNTEGPDSTNEDQINPATYTRNDREVDVSEELKSENFKTVPGSQVEDKCDKETGAFNATEADNSKYDNNPNAVILGAADLNKDKATNINDEANQNTDEGDSYGSPTEVEPRLSSEADDHEEASKTESRQISQPEGILRGDICAENANAKEFERIKQSEDNDHIQEGEARVTHNLIRNDNIGEVIPEIGVHNNNPETEEVENEHTLEKGFGTDSDTQVLVSEVAKGVLAEKHDNSLEITNIESIKEVVVQETENKEINEETESAVIDKAINIGEDEESLSTGVETAAASTSRSYLEENVEENVNELESDDKLEKNYLFDIRDENLPMQEEAVHNTQETTLSAVSADSAEVINENQVEGCESATNNTNLGSIGYNGEPESENATTEVADIYQNKGRYDDNTKNRMTEGKFSDREVIQKNLPPLEEIRSAQTQFSEDTCQTMKADACEYQVCDEKIECKKNYNTTSQDMESEVEELEDNGSKAISDDNLPDILSETGQEENIDEKAADSSNEEKTDESITVYDHDNLDKSKGGGELENSSGSVTKEPDVEELTGAVVYREEKISEEANTNDGEVVTSGTPFQEKEGSELYITRDFDSEEKVERLEQKSNNKENKPNKEEIIDACLGVSDTGSNKPRKAEIRCLSVQGIEEEEKASRNNEQDKDAELVDQMDRGTMSETLYTASPGNNIQETYKKDPEQQIHTMSVDGSTEVNAILKDEIEEDEDIQTSLPKEELQDDPQKQAEETTATAEEDTYLEQVAQMNIAQMGDSLYDNGVSFEKNMQEAITTIVQEQTGRTAESDSKDDAISSNEHIKEQDIETSLQKDNLDDEAPEKEEENHEAIKKVKNTEPVLQMCIETMGDNISTSDASIDKNMQEASDVVTEEQIYTIKEDESIEVMPIPTNENKSEQVIDKRPQEELKDEPQKKEEINHEEQASVVVAEEQFHGVPEDDSIEVREISNNENKEEQCIYASSRKEEQEDGPQEKKEEINDIDETFSLKHGKDPESVSQVNMETTDATSYANNVSFDKNIQEAPLVVETEQIPNMPEDDSIEIKENSKTENKEEQYICTSPQKVELEDEPQEKKVVIKTNDEESVYTEAVPEKNIERTDYIIHANYASSGKSIATVVFAEGRVLSMTEDDNKDVEEISKHLNIEENDIHSSLPIENLEFEPQAKEDKINVPEKEVSLEHAEDVIYQMDMGTDAILYANIASSDNNMQKTSILAVEEQIHDVPDDGGVEEKAIPETDNKEEQDIHTSLPKEEPEQEPKDKEEEETYGTCEEVKNVVRASQVDIYTTSETLNVNDASFEKNMQDVFVIYPDEQIHGMPEDDNVEASEFPENENEEEQNIQASLQEADAAPQEKQNEIEIEQKSNDISNLTMISENESFKEKELTENSSEKEKLENQDIESLNLVLEDLEKVDTTEDIHEIETKNAVKDIEEKVCKEQDMILVDPMLESAPDNQNSKPSCTTKGASSEEAILKSTCLIKGVTKVDADNEGRHCVTEVYVTHEKPEQSDINITQNEETAERSELLSTNTSFVSKEMGGETKNVEKDIVHKENASEIISAKIQDYETETQTSNKPAVDTLISHQIKEFNHPSPKHSITVTYPSEDLAPSLTTAPQSEETYEDAGEKFSRISDYWPRQETNEASNVNATGMKHSKETRVVVEGLADAEKPLCTSSGSTSTSERDVKGEEVVALPTDSGLYDIFKATEKLKEVPYLVPTEEADEKTSSVNEIRDDEESLHEPSAGQEPEVDRPEQTKKEKEMSDKAFYDNVEFSDLQNEEKKHMALGDLPVSQFLMKHVLQEQDDTKGARDDEYIDVVNEQNKEGNENDDNAAKTRDITLPVSTVQPVKETSTAQSKVDSEKLENSASVEEEEGCDVNENSEIPPAKDGKTLQSSPDYSPSGEVVAASEKNEINTTAPKVLTDSPSKESMELASTEPSILGSKVDNEECRNHDIVQDEQDNASVSEENLTEKVNNKDDESMDNSADNSYFRKAAEEDNLQKGGEQSTEHQLEIQTLEDFCAESERQFTMDDQKLIAEIESEVSQFETGEEKQNSEKQVQVPNRDTNEELKPSELHEAQQSNVAIESDVHNLQIAQKLPEGNDSTVSLDKKHIAEPTKEEEDECPPKQSGLNATTALEAKDADLEPLEKSDQTSESSEPSPFNYNKLKEAMEIEPAIKDSQSDEETREVTGRNKVKILKDDLTEKLQPSKLQKFEQSALVVEPANQQLKTPEKASDEEHKVKTTHLKEDEDITDGESDEKEEEGTQKAEESSHATTVTAETRDVELKPQKKSHGILSGVGSKVKNSIAKVKKAIKGKSPHSKAPSAK